MQPQSKAALNGKQSISKRESHHLISPEYKANDGLIEINEQYLMSRLSQGDMTAFWNLWEQYRSYLRICCLRWLGTSRYEVDDALSRASIKALNGLLNNGYNITNLKGWLSRLTRNICGP
jgi:RNA polymerase sigma-70 factor (ECF subfamily)